MEVTYMEYALGEGWMDVMIRSHVIQCSLSVIVALFVGVAAVLIASHTWKSDLDEGVSEVILFACVIVFLFSLVLMVTNAMDLITWLIEPRGTALREVARLIGSR